VVSLLDRCERISGGEVEDEDGAGGFAIVSACDGTEKLMPCSVPELQLSSTAVDRDDLRQKFDAESGVGIGLPLVVDEAKEERRFADAGVPDNDDLGCLIGGATKYRGTF
jgi:hypothetical protein